MATMTTDPVCGMSIDPATARQTRGVTGFRTGERGRLVRIMKAAGRSPVRRPQEGARWMTPFPAGS